MNTTESIVSLLEKHPHKTLAAIAAEIALNEAELIRQFPQDWVSVWQDIDVVALMDELASWGNITLIVENFGSIFEFKGHLPKGKLAMGFYNLMGNDGLQGHLRLCDVHEVALVSRPFMGKQTYAFVFLTSSGQSIFKIYLGRDRQRQLLPTQLKTFMAWQQHCPFNVIKEC